MRRPLGALSGGGLPGLVIVYFVNIHLNVHLQQPISNCVHMYCIYSVSTSSCLFPVDWRGDWFQSGLGIVTMTTRNISLKGECVQMEHEYYLLRNRQVEFISFEKVSSLSCFLNKIF